MVRILLVEDSSTDRKLLRYLLDAQMRGAVQFVDAPTLRQALQLLDSQRFDCVILDLQLPDSIGKETFHKIYAQHPDVPIVIMTNNKDRDLAIEMVKAGAADYVVKNLNDDDEIFRRIAFAMEKHKTTVRTTPDGAASYNRLRKARTSLRQAVNDGASPSTIKNVTVEATMAITDLSHKIFAEIQSVSSRVEKIDAKQSAMSMKVDVLEAEILRGYPDRPSLKSQMDLVKHRMGQAEEELKRTADIGIRVATTRLAGRTKVAVALVGFIGLIAAAAIGGAFTYWAARTKSKGPQSDDALIALPGASASALPKPRGSK